MHKDDELMGILSAIQELNLDYVEHMHRLNGGVKTIFQSEGPDRWAALGLCVSIAFFCRVEHWLLVKPAQCSLMALTMHFLSVMLSLVEYGMYGLLYAISGLDVSRRLKCSKSIEAYIKPLEAA